MANNPGDDIIRVGFKPVYELSDDERSELDIAGRSYWLLCWVCHPLHGLQSCLQRMKLVVCLYIPAIANPSGIVTEAIKCVASHLSISGADSLILHYQPLATIHEADPSLICRFLAIWREAETIAKLSPRTRLGISGISLANLILLLDVAEVSGLVWGRKGRCHG